MVIEKRIINIVNEIRDEVISLIDTIEDDEQLYLSLDDIIAHYDVEKELSTKISIILRKCLIRKGYIVDMEDDVMYIS